MYFFYSVHESLLPPHFSFRFPSLSSSLPSFASTLSFFSPWSVLWSAAVWGAECRWWEEVLRSPCQCPRMCHSRRLQRVEVWAGDWEKDERDTHTCEFHSSPQLLADGWRSCCPNSSRTLRERKRESDGESKGTGERALIWKTGSTNAALSICPTRKRGEEKEVEGEIFNITWAEKAGVISPSVEKWRPSPH